MFIENSVRISNCRAFSPFNTVNKKYPSPPSFSFVVTLLFLNCTMRLHFINEQVIAFTLFTHLVYFILLDWKNTPTYVFLFYSRKKRKMNLEDVSSSNLARMLPDNQARKLCQGNFFFLFLFESIGYLTK